MVEHFFVLSKCLKDYAFARKHRFHELRTGENCRGPRLLHECRHEFDHVQLREDVTRFELSQSQEQEVAIVSAATPMLERTELYLRL
jgi:hypothetical protein